MKKRVVIVGAGPAGLSAAIAAASEGLDVVVISKPGTVGGQMRHSKSIENYPGWRGTGAALGGHMYDQAEQFGARMLEAESTHLGAHDLRVSEPGMTYSVEFDACILAPGRRCKEPEFDFVDLGGVHSGETIDLDAVLDGRPVVVVGSGNSAGQAALYLASRTNRVDLICDPGKMSQYLADRIDQCPPIRVINGGELLAVDGRGRVEESYIATEDGMIQHGPCEAVYAFPGTVPNTEWLKGGIIGKSVSATGVIVVGEGENGVGIYGEHGDIHRIFAAGDARFGGISRIAFAVGDGAATVQQIHRYFRQSEGPRRNG